MMNYDLNSRMILRVPRFPVNKASHSLDEMLNDSVFRDALYLASDTMVDELNRNDFQLSTCSEKMKHSLAKYHKRICYRPTPFGAFAGVTVFPWRETKDPGIILAEQSFETLVINKDVSEQQPGSFSGKQRYRVNPFLYQYGTDFRILGKGEKGNQSTFMISEIFGSDIVKDLVSNHQTISQESLLRLLQNNGADKKEIDWYIRELTELQIIIPRQTLVRNFPCPLVPEHKEVPGSSYDSYCRVSAAGSLPEGVKRQLNEAMYCLEKLSSKYEPPALIHFKERFKRLFDRKEVSLLQALDPELGIDYDGLSNSPLLHPVKKPESISWSLVHELLLSKWTVQTGSGIPEIELRDQDLLELDTPAKIYPPGASVIFSVLGNKLHIKAAGGVSGLNMIGRFTVLDPHILKLAKEIAEKEMERNPNVLFAELTHLDSAKAASVNKRAIVYDYQIPFFEAPEVGDDFVIAVNDLYISLVDDCLQLRSARLKKPIIPRFSSAYNYQNSPLPVFRFLCDLQYEGTDANLNFSMANLFPGLTAYPRVTYKGLILEAASWHLEAKQLSGLKKLDQASQLTAFSAFASQIGLPEEFCYEVHDHLLHIKLSSKQDVELLLKAIPGSGKIILREYYKSQESLVKDTRGNSYTHEWIAFMTNREGSYSSGICCPESVSSVPVSKGKLFPFDEWLYFKIYLHPAGYRDLLVNYIQPFISENVRKGNISSWFFISYFDNDFHLRVRLKQTPGRETYLLKTYKKLERNLRQLPNLKKLELSTYFKERERYALIGIQSAEELFELSSEIVLSELAQPGLISDPHKEKVFSGVRHLLMVCLSLRFELTEIEELSKAVTGHLTKSQKIELDLEFRDQQRELRQFLIQNKEKGILEKKYVNRLLAAAESLQPDGKLRLLTDLNHMHLNRRYLHDQPFYEVKTYYFLFKIARSMVSYQPLFFGP